MHRRVAALFAVALLSCAFPAHAALASTDAAAASPIGAVQEFVAAVVNSTKAIIAAAETGLADVVATVNSGIASLESSGDSVSYSAAAAASRASSAASPAQAPRVNSFGPPPSAATTTPVTPVIVEKEQPIVEETSASGSTISPSDLHGILFGLSNVLSLIPSAVSSGNPSPDVENQIAALQSAISNQSYSADASPPLGGGAPNTIAAANAIDNLSGVTITNANLTASEIPALDYLSLSGGTLAGDLELDGSATTTGSSYFSGNVGIGTSTAQDVLAINGSVYLPGIASPGMTTNRLYANGGSLYWAGSAIAGATTGNWTSDGTNVWRSGGNVGIGTASPASLLSLAASSTNSAVTLLQATSTDAGSFLSFQTGGSNALDQFGDITGLNLAIKSRLSASPGLAPEGSYISGKYAYIADADAGDFVIADISNPSNPVIISRSLAASSTAFSTVHGVWVEGQYAYFDQRTGTRFSVVNVSNPAAPSVVFTGNVSSCGANSSRGIYGEGRYIYLIGTNTLCIIDVSNPASPVQVSTITDSTHFAGNPSEYVLGQYDYVVSAAGPILTVVDISNPTSPVEVGSATLGALATSIDDVAVSGRYAYVTGPNTFFVVDISNPASPTVVSTLTDAVNFADAGGRAFVSVAGHYAYVADGIVTAIDISNPASPVEVNSNNYTGDSVVRGMTLSGRYLYVGDYGAGAFDVIDTGGLDLPAASIGNIQSSDITVWNNADIGNNLNVRGGLNIGTGGIFSNGPLAVTLASTTQTGGVSAYFQGMVGIGTTKPYSPLQVTGPDTASTSAFAVVNSASTTEFTIDDNGNVGIGTTSPAATLSVSGNGYLTGGLGVGLLNTTAGTIQSSGNILGGGTLALSGTTGTTTIAAGQGFTIGGSQFVLQQGSGNVGIGTASPGSALGLAGDLTFTNGANRLIAVATSSGAAGNNLSIGSGGVSSGNFSGGALTLYAGTAQGTGFGGNVTISGGTTPGSTNTASSGGNISLLGGSVTSSSAGNGETAGGIILTAGNDLRTTTGTGGSITLNPGSGTSVNGNIILANLRGNVGIGTTTAYSRLEVFGPDAASSTSAFAVVNTSSSTVFAVFDGGNAQLSGTLTQSSDQRLKTNIQSLDGSSSLAAINALNPITFNWIDPDQDSRPQLGFLAQQVQGIFPSLVSTTSATALTPGGTLGLNYIDLLSPIVAAIQELDKEITSLASTVAGFAQSITSAIGNFGQVNAANELCVGSTCVTPAQFQAMVAAANQSASAPASPLSSPSAATDTPPVIQINGDNPAVIQVGASYTDLRATITSPQSDLNLGIQTYLNGELQSPIELDTSSAATDTIAYVVTDSLGLTSTSTRTIIVEPAAASPTPPPAATSSSATTTVQ